MKSSRSVCCAAARGDIFAADANNVVESIRAVEMQDLNLFRYVFAPR